MIMGTNADERTAFGGVDPVTCPAEAEMAYELLTSDSSEHLNHSWRG